MRIGIDARFLTHPQRGGFKTYTENLTTALARVDSENEYMLYLDRQPGPQDRLPDKENFRFHVVSSSVPMFGLPWREQIKLTRQVWKDRIDVFHAPCLTAPLNLSCPFVITVHDMIWASRKNFTSNESLSLKRRFIDWYNYLIPNMAIRRASVIITVSHASQKSIVETLQIKADQVIVTHEAADSIFQPLGNINQIESVRSKYDLGSNYILAIGSADPRKNIKLLIQAYGSLSKALREKYHLVIVWTHPFLTNEMSKQVNDLGLQNNVQFLRRVSNADLVLLYNAASLFVFPSRSEGFGLPLLEAMSCGVPVVAADNSSIPEVVCDAAFLFDAENIDSLSQVLIRVLNDEILMKTMSTKGIERAAKFSWDKCANETIAVYKSLYGTRNFS